MTQVIIDKIKLALGVYIIDADESNRLDFHIKAAYNFFSEIKGIQAVLLESESGIQLMTIYVNDVWREQGEFKFSPATEILFNCLMDANSGLTYANNNIS